MQFEAFKINEVESVKDFSCKLLNVVNKLRLLREYILDEKVIEKILISLSIRFESMISTIQESCYLKTISVFKLLRKL